MIVKVLGAGCKKCSTLEENVKKVINENQIDAVVEKVTDIQEFIKYGILSTPALIIDEKVVSYGTVPSNVKLLEWLKKGN